MSDKGRDKLLSDWYLFAEEDLAAAKELFKENGFFHQTCLLCQQSVEKFLKGYLLSKGWSLLKTHELSRLVSECCSFEKSFEVLYTPCEYLNGYVIAARYPGDLPFESTTNEDAQKAIDAAEEVSRFLNKRRAQLHTNQGADNFKE